MPKVRGERGGGEHRVLWCTGIERPKRKPPDEEGEREWRSWCEIEECIGKNHVCVVCVLRL